MIRIENSNFRRRLIFSAIVGSVGILMVSYAYLLNVTIFDGVHIENTEKKIATLNSTVGNLEQQYFEAKKSVTLSLAKNLGFTDAESELYISRQAPKELLSIRDEK
jgi:hypothetical protein